MDNREMPRIVAYIRSATMEEENIIRQRREISEFAKKQGQVINEFIEVSGVSGIGKCPDVLLNSLNPGDILIITDLFRLSRDFSEHKAILHELERRRITLIVIAFFERKIAT